LKKRCTGSKKEHCFLRQRLSDAASHLTVEI
jgi:hypothetical protein